MVRKLLSLLYNKILIVSILILIQLSVFFDIVSKLSEYFIAIYLILIALGFCMSICIINKNDNPTYKLTRVLLIMAVSVSGGLIYLLSGGRRVPKELYKRDGEALENYQEIFWRGAEIVKVSETEDPLAHKQANYLWKNVIFLVYNHIETTYFLVDEEKFKAMVEELKETESFISMEYFIIALGVMWDTILDTLIDKMEQDVEVCVVYDDAGCTTTLPQDYYLTLRRLGIQAKVFNPIKPWLTTQVNNRDHRKILAIDEEVGMTGGINLVDEYINRKERFGYWKDCSIMIRGGAVQNLTLMSLQFWNYDEKEKDDVFSYKPDFKVFENIRNDSYVQPYSGSPTDEEGVGEYTHVDMINSASRYVYATTPHLAVDNGMKTALLLVAKNEIDARILVPHIPDKWYVFAVTRPSYKGLIGGGVKVYGYVPGFVHGKSFVAGDKMTIVGMVNIDYRSYYLHYECGV